MKDAKGHGSNNKLAPNATNKASGNLRQSFQKLYGGRPNTSPPGDRTLGADSGSGSSVTFGGHGGDWGNMQAAQNLASGPKSAPVDVHDAMYDGVRDPDDLRTS